MSLLIKGSKPYIQMTDTDTAHVANIKNDGTQVTIDNDVQISKATPSVKLNDTGSGTTATISYDGTKVSLDKEFDATKIVDTTINASLDAHGSRHSRGGADAPDYSLISQLFDSGDVSCGVGTGGSATRTTVYSLPTNWYNLVPLAVYMEVGGTVASGETISISVKAVLDDGSEFEIASYSVTGTTGSKTETAPFANLLSALRSAGVTKDGNRITSIVADVSSSAASTSATATVRVVGIRT